MPYQTGQDIGGFGRLAEAQRWVKGQERLDIKEARSAKLFNLQMEVNQNNVDEIKRGREFKQQYMQALSGAKPGEHYNTGQKFLNEYSQANPDNADLALSAMNDLDATQSDVLDDLRKIDPAASLRAANATIFKKHGIVAEDAGHDLEKGDLFELFDSESGSPMGIYYNDPKTDQPKLYSKASLKPKTIQDEIEMNDEQVAYFGQLLNLTGKMPTLGRGKAAGALRAKIAQSAAEQAVEAGGVSETLGKQADVKALGTSITQQTKQLGSMGSFVKNLGWQVDRVNELAKDIKTSDVRLLNIPIRLLKKRVAGNAALAKYELYLKEIEGEIGKLATGSTASVAELSQGAQEAWAKIHDKNLSVADMMELLEETKHAGEIRIKSVEDNLEETRAKLRAVADQGATEQAEEHPADIQAILGKYGGQ